MQKVGIFAPALFGDLATVTSVLKYHEKLWTNHEIIWFANPPYDDILKFNNAISEIRPWHNGWRGNADDNVLAKGLNLWEDWSILKTENNALDQKLKHNFELTKDLDIGYFPTPWMMSVEQRHGIDYPNISRRVFGADPSWEWHPVLYFSKEETKMTDEFCHSLPHIKRIMLETFLSSGQRYMSDEMIRKTMKLCRDRFGKCNFIFASNTDNSRFVDDTGVVSCPQFTVRQLALINNHCDLFIGVGSGISVVTSAWNIRKNSKIQFTGSFIGSTVSLSAGSNIESIYHDYRILAEAEKEYYFKLTKVLNGIG